MAVAEEKSIDQYLTEGNAQFTSRMFSEVVKANPGKSVVMSAFSVLTPLAQLGLASVGASHDELLKAIGLPNDNVTKSVFSLVNQKLRSVKGVELKAASKVYIPTGFELNDDFAVISRDVFGSEVKNVDFTKSTETSHEINEWVEEQTNHRIKDLVSPDSLGPDTRAVLVNAIYFKGSWKSKFEKALTHDRDFYVDHSNTVKVPMMFKKDDFLYGESAELNAKLLSLPYEGDESSFLIVLPNDVEGLAALEEKLKDPSALPNAMKHMYSTEVEVYIPKFKIETKTDLKSVLQNMDVKRIFSSSEASLDNLLKHSKGLYVSEAIQKAFIEVNEEGAEAAAANVYGISDRFDRGTDVAPKQFRADRPFYFSINYGSKSIFNGVYYAVYPNHMFNLISIYPREPKYVIWPRH